MSEGRVTKVYIDRRCDPDFGTEQPEIVDAYFVEVYPGGDTRKSYEVIVVIPEMSDEQSKSLLREVLAEFLEDGDEYMARTYTHDDHEDFDINWSIIGFDPKMEDIGMYHFFWIKPPIQLMN